MDIAFILEGGVEKELPEQVLGAFRIHNLEPIKCSELPKWDGEGELVGVNEEGDVDGDD